MHKARAARHGAGDDSDPYLRRPADRGVTPLSQRVAPPWRRSENQVRFPKPV